MNCYVYGHAQLIFSLDAGSRVSSWLELVNQSAKSGSNFEIVWQVGTVLSLFFFPVVIPFDQLDTPKPAPTWGEYPQELPAARPL